MDRKQPGESCTQGDVEDRIDLLLEAEAKIAEATVEGTCGPAFYELLYRTACRIAPTDSFYACLYDEASQTLYFPCNWEGESFETCAIKPLGSGPTSWVIRHGKTYTLEDDNGAVQHSRNRFGDVARVSLSAIHAPMIALDLEGQDRLHGVLSMQCYQIGAYSRQVIRIFEWLARRAGAALQREQDRARARDGRRLQQQTNEFNRVLKEISRRAEEARSLLKGHEDPAIQSSLVELCRLCYQSQSQAVIYAHQPAATPSASTAIDGLASNQDPFLRLTRQERNVLVLLTLHRTYPQMAVELSVEVSTVKSHVANILRKLSVSGRGEAAQLAEPFVQHYGCVKQ